MSFTNYSADLLNNFLLNAGVATRPTAWFVELHLGDPGVTGAGNPVTTTQDTAYVRKAVTFGASASKQSLNTNAPSWTVAAGSAGYSVTHITIWDALTAGNCLRRGKLAVPEALVANGIFTLAVGKIIEAITVESLA